MDKKELLAHAAELRLRAEFAANLCESSKKVAETTPLAGIINLLANELCALRDGLAAMTAAAAQGQAQGRRAQGQGAVRQEEARAAPAVRALPAVPGRVGGVGEVKVYDSTRRTCAGILMFLLMSPARPT